MKKKVILLGRGDLAIRIANWFMTSENFELVNIVPVVPEPLWMNSLIEWSKKNNEQFIVIEPKDRKIKPKNYASNFDMNRKEPWTH